MLMKIPPLTVLAIVMAAAAAVAAPMAEPGRNAVEQRETPVTSHAAQGVSPTAAAAAAIPTVAPFYTLPLGEVAGPRVSFLQDADVLTSIWMTPQGDTYGSGTYHWDPLLKAFTGASTTVYQCLSDDGRVASTFQYEVKEQLFVVSARQLRDRWRKPLDVDCAGGLVDKFRWYEREWVASDKDWKPLDSSPAAQSR
jgi:hypothetical protein